MKIRSKNFDALINAVTNKLIFEAYSMQDYVNGLRAQIYQDPRTVYYGRILQNMNIVVINDVNPREVNYEKDANGNYVDEYRHPIGAQIFGMDRPTMAVDIAGNLYIGENFILKEIYGKFSDEQVAAEVVKAVLLHESMHISELSFFRGEGRRGQIWNIATDAYINFYLVKNGYKLPEGIIPDADGNITLKLPTTPPIELKYSLLGKSAELIYYEIVKLWEPEEPEEEESEGNGPPPPPRPLQRGDPVYNTKTGEYGVVLDPGAPSTRVITKEEAMLRAKLKKKGIVQV